MMPGALHPGDTVLHRKFGYGVVLELDGNELVKVEFVSGDVKWLDTRIAPMRLIDESNEITDPPEEKARPVQALPHSETGTVASLEYAASCWSNAVEIIARGWDCIDEYQHDLFSRELLEEEITAFSADAGGMPEALEEKIHAADKKFRYVTIDSGLCVWPDSQKYTKTGHWYYYRWPLDSVVADMESLRKLKSKD